MKKSLKAAGTIPFILTISAVVLWSTGGPVIRRLDINPWTILFWRTAFMALTVILWSLAHGNTRKKISISEAVHGLPVSIFISFSLILYIMSMKKTGIADSLLIQGTAPFFIVIAGRLYLKEKIPRKTSFALVGVAAGFLIIFIPAITSTRLSGNIFGLLKAITFSLTAISVRKLKNINMIPATGIAAIIACIISFIAAPEIKISSEHLLLLLYLGVIQTGMGFMLFTSWSSHLPSAVTGIVVLLEAVLGPLWVWIFNREVPPAPTIVGGLLITISLILYSILKGRTAPDKHTNQEVIQDVKFKPKKS